MRPAQHLQASCVDDRSRTSLLLSRGYFPRELPLAFTTADFGRHADDLIAHWEQTDVVKYKKASKIGGKYKNGCYSYKINPTEAEIISAPKKGFERRSLQIVHPVPQAFLASELSENWRSIQKLLTRNLFSLDQISVNESAPRGIPNINFDAHRAKKAFIEATANWLVKTDITRFYPSIYTHSIPWAAYGKENVRGLSL